MENSKNLVLIGNDSRLDPEYDNTGVRGLLRYKFHEIRIEFDGYIFGTDEISYNKYAYLVPFVETKDQIFLKTIIPSRKATRKYMKL